MDVPRRRAQNAKYSDHRRACEVGEFAPPHIGRDAEDERADEHACKGHRAEKEGVQLLRGLTRTGEEDRADVRNQKAEQHDFDHVASPAQAALDEKPPVERAPPKHVERARECHALLAAFRIIAPRSTTVVRALRRERHPVEGFVEVEAATVEVGRLHTGKGGDMRRHRLSAKVAAPRAMLPLLPPERIVYVMRK